MTLLTVILLIGLTTITVSAYRYDFNYAVTAEVMDVCPVSTNDSGDYRVRFYSSGVDQYVSMTENERQNWTLSSYIDVDPEEICNQTSLGAQLAEYRNLTSYMINNIDQCTLLLPALNDTHYFASNFGNLSEAYGRIHENYLECKNRSKEMKTERDEAVASLTSKTSSLQNCIASRDKYSSDLKACNDEADETKSSKDNFIWWGLGGLGIGFFIGKRKSTGKTSEQEEFGIGGDEYETVPPQQ